MTEQKMEKEAKEAAGGRGSGVGWGRGEKPTLPGAFCSQKLRVL